MKWRVELEAETVIEALERLRRSAEDLTEPLSQIGHMLAENTRLRFHDGRAPDKMPWAPLSDTTLQGRRKGRRSRAPTAQALRDTGVLMNSITYQAGRNEVVVGTSVVYAPTHQFGALRGAYGRTRRGAPIPWGDIPARPFLGLSPEDKDEAVEILQDYFRQ